MAVPLSFSGEFLHARLGSYELNLVYEYQNVDRETESYPGELVSVLGCHFFFRVVMCHDIRSMKF